MKLYTRKIATYILLSITLCSFAGFASQADAQSQTPSTPTQQNNFSVSPGKFEVFVNPGDVVNRSISVSSNISGTTQFQVTTEDFVGSRDEDEPVVLLGNDKSPYSFKDNLIPGLTTFSLSPGQNVVIPIQIKVPANAQPGGFYASVIVSTVPPDSASSSAPSARIISRIASLFFIRVNGPVNQQGSLEDFRIKGPTKSVYSSGPFTFQVLFNNTGTVYLVPYGSISVSNLFGHQIANLPIDAYFSLPNSLRYRDIDWDPGFLFGYYRAHLSLSRGYNNLTDQKTIGIWVIPWKITVTVLVVLILLCLLIVFLAKNFKLTRK